MKDVFDAAFFDRFFKGPLRQYTFDGKPYGLADMAQDFGVFANDRIMKKVGLDVPNTWDEMIADAPKLKAAGFIPLGWGNLTRNTCPDFFCRSLLSTAETSTRSTIIPRPASAGIRSRSSMRSDCWSALPRRAYSPPKSTA